MRVRGAAERGPIWQIDCLERPLYLAMTVIDDRPEVEDVVWHYPASSPRFNLLIAI